MKIFRPLMICNPTPSNMSICDAEIESDPYDLVDLRS